MSNSAISIKQLRAFVAVADAKSFVVACEVLHLSQPALTSAIQKLEQCVGGDLLTRTTRAVALTPEGQSFLPIAKRLLKDWDEAFDDLQSLFAKQRGKLSIAAMTSFATSQLPLSMAEFHQQYPNIKVDVHDTTAEQVVDLVRLGRVDFGIAFRPQQCDELLFDALFDDHFVVLMPNDHPLSQYDEVSWYQLAGQDLVLLQHSSSLREQIQKTADSVEVELSIVAEAHQLVTIGQLVANGVGLSIVPALALAQVGVFGVTSRPFKEVLISREIGIISHRRYPMSSAGKAMAEIIGRQR